MTISSAVSYSLELYTAAFSLLHKPEQSVTFSRSATAGPTMALSDQSGLSQDIISLSTNAILALSAAKANSATKAAGVGQSEMSSQVLGDFAKIYAQHAADGVEGRFYKSTDLNVTIANMPKDQADSFSEAFKNHTLKIQTYEDAGVKTDGSQSVALSNGGMTWSGGGTVDLSAVVKSNKYCLTCPDPIFGDYVVSWGGPPAPT